MAKRDLPSPDALRQLLRYEPDTGKLFWKERGPEWFGGDDPWRPDHRAAAWNRKLAGEEAFARVAKRGYAVGTIFGQRLTAHRVIWAIVFGEWPNGQIDHINLDRADNRLANLREASVSENMCNRFAKPGSASGLKGVTWQGQIGKWFARISMHGREEYLGVFDTAKDAHDAYCRAALRLHGEFARTK